MNLICLVCGLPYSGENIHEQVCSGCQRKLRERKERGIQAELEVKELKLQRLEKSLAQFREMIRLKEDQEIAEQETENFVNKLEEARGKVDEKLHEKYLDEQQAEVERQMDFLRRHS